MKLLIADDEAIVLEGLKHIINWEFMGFSVCSVASNGEEAYKKILNINPELVLLDIKMPKMSGIEIVKQARERGFKGHFIILSGYSDFTYAQTAIRYGVDYYLTKPIDEYELEEAVRKVHATIQEACAIDTTLHQYREKARDTILRHLLTGDGDISTLNLEDLHITAGLYKVIIYERYNQTSFQPFWNFADLLRVTNQDNNSFDHITIKEQEVIILKNEFALERFQNFLSHYNKNPQKGSPLDSLFLTYGRTVYRMDQLIHSYEDALSLMQRRFFCEPNQHVFSYETLPKKHQLTYRIDDGELQYYSKTLSESIHTHNRFHLVEALKALEANLYYTKDDINAVKHYLIGIFLQIKQNISYSYSTANIPFPTNSSIIEIIEGKYYLYEVMQFMTEQFDMCLNAIGNPTSENILDDVLYYINHNYQDNLKLESIAMLFGYNSSYLGKIFTRKVGESFNSFLDKTRIEHSKELLSEEKLKIYEISDKVGYKNVDYFHKKFKKYIGISPAEYRKSIIDNRA